ncbi:unnamed protein product [Echinostoma caproni]|uniref:Noggin n=1 Tax=Echinostoma caproni TaxID=27848 RepID=A0A183A6V9_9TREM|nr:unnamed protein product [Echinostoma caproni]
MIVWFSVHRGLYGSGILFITCTLSLIWCAIIHDSESVVSNMTVPRFLDSSTRNRVLQTDAERMNASRRLWELFQRRNQASEQSSSVLLYPSNRKNTSRLDLDHSSWTNLRDNQTHNLSNRRLPHPLQLLHLDPQPQFPIHMPRFPPEHPFNPRAILSPAEMLRMLGRQNYIPEFMSFTKPIEAVMYPDGHLTPVRLTRWQTNQRVRGSNMGRDRNRNRNNRNQPSESPGLPADLTRRLETIGYNLWAGDSQTIVHQFNRQARGSRSGRTQTQTRTERRRARQKRRVRKALRRLLMDYTSCPVLYRWRDWGQRFWPRWIKEGKCVNLGQTSCSIPPGMFCVEAAHRSIVVLRFLCFTSWPRSSCSWYRFNLPVLSRCQCGCLTKPSKVK